MALKGILVDKKVVPVDDALEWDAWHEGANRHVGDDYVNGVHVSTVFLGINHGWFGQRDLWFETMIFGGHHDLYQKRYETWEEAELGHKEALKLVLI